MIQKTIACLLACLFIGHFNSLEAQTNTQKESTYIGEQKNGQPEGKGVLTDTAGNVYNGSFKKGKKDGYGELTLKNAVAGKDNVIVGYWKKDQYIGIYEFPYKIISKSYMISTASVTYEPANPSSNIIEISVESVSGGSATLSGELPKPTLTDHVFNKGSFQEMIVRTNQQKRNVYIFQNVIFPVQAIFKFGNEDITVDFNETKNYKLTVVLRD